MEACQREFQPGNMDDFPENEKTINQWNTLPPGIVGTAFLLFHCFKESILASGRDWIRRPPKYLPVL